MTARELIEHICSGKDDVWQTHFMSLDIKMDQILEAWSEQAKKQIVSRASGEGKSLIDHVVLDTYDLVLWKIPCDVTVDPRKFIFAVSINSEEHNPNDFKTQATKFPGSSLRHFPITSVTEIVRKWIGTYGKLSIGSSDLRKLSSYANILSRKGFKIAPLYQSNPLYGFTVESV